MFIIRKKTKERSFFVEIYKSIWNFWTSPTGAFILAVSAMVLGYYQFYISRPILKYYTNTVKIISSSNSSGYEVRVKEKKYGDLFLTKVYLYNLGNEALSGLDVSHLGHDPIRIEIPEDAEMVHFTLDNEETTSAITAKIEPYKNDLILNFDFLNPEYQYVVNILHKNQTSGIKIVGSALNVNKITKAIDDKKIKAWIIWGLCIFYLVLVIRYILKKKFGN